MFNTLNGCSYVVGFKGYNSQSGKKVQGAICLASSGKNDAAPIWKNDYFAEDLTKDLQQNPLILEIVKHGFSEPEIERVK